MTHTYRMILMVLSLIVMVVIGRIATGSFEFWNTQFWFVSGALLLIMLSLIDQPHFSKDANIFVNGSTALVSLFVVIAEDRNGFWFIFMLWALYLIVSSFWLMSVRSKDLSYEGRWTQFFSRINRHIGRPEAIFSAFLFWGVFYQFSYVHDEYTINAVFLFWAVFIVLNMPSVAGSISSLFEVGRSDEGVLSGVVESVHVPNIVDIKLSVDLKGLQIGNKGIIKVNGDVVAEGYLYDEKVIRGKRLGKLAISEFYDGWSMMGSGKRGDLHIVEEDNKILGIVDKGTSIKEVVFSIRSECILTTGQVIGVSSSHGELFYQIVNAQIIDEPLFEGNSSLTVRVEASQLGCWDHVSARFDPIAWVPRPGTPIELHQSQPLDIPIPENRAFVGSVPNSSFPVHVDVSDSVTHNTAIIGVTGSGKSYLAFELIEAYLSQGIKVLILDPTRQHWEYLEKWEPTAIRRVDDLQDWFGSESNLGVYQFAIDTSLPKATADFSEECFRLVKEVVQLRAGVDVSAQLAIIFEEAHSLIPEWNQVANSGDTSHVNRTARVVLQGRKFGMGCMVVTQRTANVTKTILNQCNTIFALRSFDQTGLDFLENYMGKGYSQSISTLQKYHAILVGKASSSSSPVMTEIKDMSNRGIT